MTTWVVIYLLGMPVGGWLMWMAAADSHRQHKTAALGAVFWPAVMLGLMGGIFMMWTERWLVTDD